MNKSPRYNQQAEQSSASLKLRKYVSTKTWKVAVTTSISKNKYWQIHRVPC